MFFLHFMLFPTFLKETKFWEYKFLFHIMFSLCFFMLDLFPTFLDFFWGNIEKCPFTYGRSQCWV